MLYAKIVNSSSFLKSDIYDLYIDFIIDILMILTFLENKKKSISMQILQYCLFIEWADIRREICFQFSVSEHGRVDNLLSNLWLASLKTGIEHAQAFDFQISKVMFLPAINLQSWDNPRTQILASVAWSFAWQNTDPVACRVPSRKKFVSSWRSFWIAVGEVKV